MGRRNQLNDMLQAEKNHLRSSAVEVKSSVNRSIAFLKTELKDLEAQIQAFLKAHEDLGEREKLLCTTKSVGPVTATTLLACQPP